MIFPVPVASSWSFDLGNLGRSGFLRIGSIVSFLSGTCSFVLATRLTFTRSKVNNFVDPEIFTAPTMIGFIQQDPNNPSLLQFRRLIENVVPLKAGCLDRAVALRQWVRAQQPDHERCWYPHRSETEDPERLLAEQRRGVPGACRRFSYILTGALLSAGLNARIAVFGKSFDQRTELSHSVVEVWCEELGKWVLLDATYDTLIMLDGLPASAFELYQALRTGNTSGISFDRAGSERKPVPRIQAYAGVCGHFFVAQTNAIFDGYRVRMWGKRRISFAHFAPNGEKRYPERTKRILFATATASFVTYFAFLWTMLVSSYFK
jgi:hypothetical protein